MKIAAIIPCYKIKNDLISLLNKSLDHFDVIIVVDDNCPYKTGSKVLKKFKNNKKIYVIHNKINLGVGGAVKKGIEYLIKSDVEIFVKIDGDGQMSLEDLDHMLLPIKNGNASYVKGSRFLDIKSRILMPKLRYYGNKLMSIMYKFFSNDISVSDPLNGYLIMHRNIFKSINLNKLSNDFFFETDLLFNLKDNSISVVELPVLINYEDHSSSFKPLFESFNFIFKFLNKSLNRLIFYHLNIKFFSIMFIPTVILVYFFFYSLINLLNVIFLFDDQLFNNFFSIIKTFIYMISYFLIYRLLDIIVTNVKR